MEEVDDRRRELTAIVEQLYREPQIVPTIDPMFPLAAACTSSVMILPSHCSIEGQDAVIGGANALALTAAELVFTAAQRKKISDECRSV